MIFLYCVKEMNHITQKHIYMYTDVHDGRPVFCSCVTWREFLGVENRHFRPQSSLRTRHQRIAAIPRHKKGVP